MSLEDQIAAAAERLRDPLTMLGVDPNERQIEDIHGVETPIGEDTASTLARIVLSPMRPARERPMPATYTGRVNAIADEWRHLIDALTAAGAQGVGMWQTGGFCMLIGWTVDEAAGVYALLGTDHGPLSHERAEETRDSGSGSYAVGVYIDEDDTAEHTMFMLPARLTEPEDDWFVARQAVALARAMYELETSVA